ncbi:MAG: NUDIX hydrolase [Oscillospiraceae bacterium]|nr:NUDIX hydrolase [Oscillospiraceae bacterium]
MQTELTAAPHLKEEQLRSEEIYRGRILDITRDTVLLENGAEATREVVHHPGGACVVPLTEDGQVLMVRQFRYPHRQVTLEIPAGKLEYGENPLECAVRELKEEVGGEADHLEPLGALLPTPAYDEEVIYMYLARQISSRKAQSLDEDEFLDVIRMPLDEAVQMVMDDRIRDAKTQIALLKTAFLLEHGQNTAT